MMFSILRKSFSGEKPDDIKEEEPPCTPDQKSAKRSRSEDQCSTGSTDSSTKKLKKKKFSKQNAMSKSDEKNEPDDSICLTDSEGFDGNATSSKPSLPVETPDWGIKLLEIMRNEFRSVANCPTVQCGEKEELKQIEQKLTKVQDRNKKIQERESSSQRKGLGLRI